MRVSIGVAPARGVIGEGAPMRSSRSVSPNWPAFWLPQDPAEGAVALSSKPVASGRVFHELKNRAVLQHKNDPQRISCMERAQENFYPLDFPLEMVHSKGNVRRICCKRLRHFRYGDTVSRNRPVLFRGRHCKDIIIVLCVRWYLRYSLSYRDLEEIMAEHGLAGGSRHDLALGPALRPPFESAPAPGTATSDRSWRVDETYVRVAGNWTYLYRAVDSAGDTIDFMVVAQTRLDGGQAVPSFRIVWNWRHPTPRSQRGWTPSLCPRHCRIEAIRRSERPIQLPAITIIKQHHRAGSPLHQKAHCGESWIPLSGRSMADDRRL